MSDEEPSSRGMYPRRSQQDMQFGRLGLEVHQSLMAGEFRVRSLKRKQSEEVGADFISDVIAIA
jgi:hypothetical protein